MAQAKSGFVILSMGQPPGTVIDRFDACAYLELGCTSNSSNDPEQSALLLPLPSLGSRSSLQ
jgi:hypothetical protein